MQCMVVFAIASVGKRMQRVTLFWGLRSDVHFFPDAFFSVLGHVLIYLLF